MNSTRKITHFLNEVTKDAKDAKDARLPIITTEEQRVCHNISDFFIGDGDSNPTLQENSLVFISYALLLVIQNYNDLLEPMYSNVFTTKTKIYSQYHIEKCIKTYSMYKTIFARCKLIITNLYNSYNLSNKNNTSKLPRNYPVNPQGNFQTLTRYHKLCKDEIEYLKQIQYKIRKIQKLQDDSNKYRFKYNHLTDTIFSNEELVTCVYDYVCWKNSKDLIN
jgi:hypothetical protein